MSAILPSIHIDRDSVLSRFFTPYQIHWIYAEEALHSQGKQAFILAEKSVRIGWTFADAFKNVRKRLQFKNRDYLFATKDYASALEYIRLCKQFAEVFNVASSIITHGEEYHKVPRLDDSGKPTAFTDEISMGVIKFHNGSRILAFSAHPQAMAVYGGDVGLDEFAKHQRARLLWETAQGRVTWGGDLAVWSAHDGEDTLFNELAHEARTSATLSHTLSDTLSVHSALAAPKSDAGGSASASSSSSSSSSSKSDPSVSSNVQRSVPLPPLPPLPRSRFKVRSSMLKVQSLSRLTHSLTRSLPLAPSTRRPLWNLYYRLTIVDAIELGLLEVINLTQGKNFSPNQFIADCRSRAREEEIFQQAYMCNPLGSAANHIVEWSAIERCREDYEIERVHLEADDVRRKFGEFEPARLDARQSKIESFLSGSFPHLFDRSAGVPGDVYRSGRQRRPKMRLGFDVAASGQGDLAAIYIDEAKSDDLWLRALFTCRTEDWNFLKIALFHFLRELKSVQAVGDESGLGRQICWEAAREFPSRFSKVNFTSKKHDLGFGLMNQLANAEKHFPKNQPDIAADFFALRKSHTGTRWVFNEGRNTLCLNSHCDIAWAAALSTYAHSENRWEAGARA